ncbi:SbcC/MukB-like Walker B domain-containing protein [Pseudomonas bohemica]|uniref:SbcC/MukB-like Walker B domain-containing protein n=1 Tax=Pseudomonas bohemica TaxID=2044872 RepID=UPI000DA634B8|nr:SbcC/MukB-like Walker B domain-containing protein [Pseudomonas bohemica]
MKRLESIKLVQFLLYESEEFRVGETSAIFGSNGSGKSSALDAVQIAMFGANKSHMAFNAQADATGSKLTRSLRSYCLGQYGDQIVDCARPNSTTYITLTWRNTETNEPTTTGICIEASLEAEDATVVGRYVVNGLELAMSDHLQSIEDDFSPLPWKSFRTRLKERANILGEDPFYDDPSSFTKQVLFALRGKNGQPSYDAFIRAFRFALRMKFDKTVDHIVRNDVLESRPTNVKKFKAIVDTFKHLNLLIQNVEKKIAQGKAVAGQYLAAQTKLRRAVSWRAMAAIAQEEEAQLAYENADDVLQKAIQTTQRLTTTSQRLRDSLLASESEIQHLTTRQHLHAAHKENADAHLGQVNAQQALANGTQALHDDLQKVCIALDTAVESPYLAEVREHTQSLAARLRLLISTPGLANVASLRAPLEEMASVGMEIKTILEAIVHELSGQVSAITEEIRVLDGSLTRVMEGRAPLSDDAQVLLRELRDEGLNPTPVCDLVKIIDPGWQPAIEAYLGKNTEALLLPEDQEEQAFEIYRELKGRRAAFGVKIVRSNQVKIAQTSLKGLVAELIEGLNPIAVGYLRGQLGNLKRAEGKDDALKGERTLTMDGMYVSPRDFERLRLNNEKLRIGAGTRSQADRLKAELASANLKLRRNQDQLTSTRRTLDVISGLGSEFASRLILSRATAYEEAVRQCELANQRVANIADAEYVEICERIKTLQAVLNRLKTDERNASNEAIKSESLIPGMEQTLASSKLRYEQCILFKQKCREHIDYDPDFVSAEWSKLIERFDSPDTMIAHCQEASQTNERTGNTQANGAQRDLWAYLQEHRETLPQQDVEDWRLAKAWIDNYVQKLEITELPEYKAQAEEAYRASQETFRRDVAIALNTNLEFLRQTFDRLNAALLSTPLFTNGERYQFMYKKRPHLKDLLEFIEKVADYGVDGGLFGDAGSIPPQFEELLKDKAAPGNSGEKSPLDDYREFYEFDIRIEQVAPDNTFKTIGHLSSRIGPGSGGEHRAPLYVIAGAGLWSAYRMDHGGNDGLRLIMLDEAFDKMDPSNTVATMKYLQELGLQVLLASPGENLGILNAFLDSYFEIQKDAVRHVVQVDRMEVTAAMRDQFREDLWEFHPELVEEEILAIRNQSNGSQRLADGAAP